MVTFHFAEVIYDEVNLQLSQIPLIERQKDVSDFEWNLWIPLLGLLLPWIVIHFVLAQILCYVNKQVTEIFPRILINLSDSLIV